MPSEVPVVLISGASSGIGRSTALELAKLKWRLSLSGRNEEAMAAVVKECKKTGATDVTTTVGDLRDDEVAKDFVDHTLQTFGRIDSLVNAAGILVNGTVEDSSLTDYDKQFDVNVRSIIALTKYALPHIIKTKGTIVNVSSVAGTNAFPGVTYYCMSKAALDQFTKCLALEMAPHGVRVNSVNPGVIVSNIHRRAGLDDAQYKAVS
uniref:3-oxoacyl-[acyl-carrier-protein] reductase FabG n=1 Tax=Bursaphelenchus xylophilus TaxID=6326 RepID=A0A1I7RL59_BURXY